MNEVAPRRAGGFFGRFLVGCSFPAPSAKAEGSYIETRDRWYIKYNWLDSLTRPRVSTFAQLYAPGLRNIVYNQFRPRKLYGKGIREMLEMSSDYPMSTGQTEMAIGQAPTLTQRLTRQKDECEARLADINDALTKLTKNSDIQEAVDAITKLGGL